MKNDIENTSGRRGFLGKIRIQTANNSTVLTIILSITAVIFSTFPNYCVIGKFPLYDYVLFFGIILAWLFRENFHKNSPAVRCILLVFAVLMMICQLSHHERLVYLRTMLEYIGPFILLGCFIENRKQIQTVIDSFLLFTAFMCVMGILETVTQFNIWSIIETSIFGDKMGSISEVRYGIYRIEQSFGQCLPYSTYLLAVSLLAWYRFFSAPQKKIRILLLILLLLIGVNIFLTNSRLAFIIFILLGAGVVFIRSKRKKLIILAVSASLLIAIFILCFTNLLNQNTYILALINMFNPNDTVYGTSMAYRIGLLTAFPSIIKGNYALGVGSSALQEPFLIRIPACPAGFLSTSIDNNYLFRTAQYGLVGLSAFLFYYLGTVIWVTARAKNIRKEKMRLLFQEHPFLLVVPIIMAMYLLVWISVAQITEFRVFNVILGLYAAYFRVFTEEMRANGLGEIRREEVTEKTENGRAVKELS